MSGAVHDLGYRRYVGTRRPPSTRWIVILRNQLATAWSTWWRYKAWLAASVLIMVTAGAVMYLWQAEASPLLSSAGVALPVADIVVPETAPWFARVAFVLTLTIGAGAIASDTSRGAFTFYFSRPVRPIDYLAGKLGGMFILMAIVMAAPLVLLTVFRAGLVRDAGEVMGHAARIPRALGAGLLGALAFAAVPLGFSAAVGRPRNAILAWIAYYVIVGGLAQVIGFATGAPIGVLSLLSAYSTTVLAALDVDLGMKLLGREVVPPLGWALASLVGQSALAIGVAYIRIRAAQRTGVVGGGS